MKNSILALLLSLTASTGAFAVEVVPPAQTEDQQKAEQMAKENAAKKPSLEERRLELKKKHAKKKQEKAAAKEAAEQAKANAADRSNVQSGDLTTIQTPIRDAIEEEKREDRSNR